MGLVDTICKISDASDGTGQGMRIGFIDFLDFLIGDLFQRVDDDGEVANTYDHEYSTAATSVTLPFTADQTRLSWSVRAVDDNGANSPWSTLWSFWIKRDGSGPTGPSGFVAYPGNGRIDLAWSPSTSVDLKEYRLATRVGSGIFGPYISVGNVTSYGGQKLLDGSGSELTFVFSPDVSQTSTLELPTVSTGNLAEAIDVLDAAAGQVLAARGTAGAFEKYTIESSRRLLDSIEVNVSSALSSILDTDVAAETSRLVRSQILVDASISSLVVAGQRRTQVARLLGAV